MDDETGETSLPLPNTFLGGSAPRLRTHLGRHLGSHSISDITRSDG
jgi:hypothetical protein